MNSTTLFSRRRVLAGMAALCSAFGMTNAAFSADAWPSRPITLVVPYPAGGPTDAVSRLIGQKLSERFKQPVIVENRAGASGVIGATYVKQSTPDGYTLMMVAGPVLLAPHLYKTARYSMITDFASISGVYDVPIVLVVNTAVLPEVKSLPDLIAKAKAEGGKLNYTSSGPGSFGHLTIETLKDLGHFDMQHIAYKGAAPAMTDVLAGQVPITYADLSAALPHINSGKLRAIATGSPQRLPMLPDVKTIAEQGFPDFAAVSWGGLVAPAGTPAQVIDRVSSEVRDILADKDVQERLLAIGTMTDYQSSAEMAARIRSDDARWSKVIRDKNIVLN